MSQFSNPKELFKARAHMWIDQIIKNLEAIEAEFEKDEYIKVRENLGEQYQLIQVIRNAKNGKTILQGWKTESNSTGE